MKDRILGKRTPRNKLDVVAIGGSTGGPKAVQQLIIKLGPDFPAAVLVALHMPPKFTQIFAERLNELSYLNVKEAKEGDLVRPGEVLIAPGGKHLLVFRDGKSKAYIRLSEKPSDLAHIPSIDVMMASVAEVYRSQSLGVILTGMGTDGVHGMKCIKENGGITLAQSKASCTIYGMPRACIESGIIDKVIHLSRLSEHITQLVTKPDITALAGHSVTSNNVA